MGIVCMRGSVSQTPGDSSTSPHVPEVEMRNGLAPKLLTWRQNTRVLLCLTQIYFVPLYKSLHPSFTDCGQKEVVFHYLTEVLDT